jgi:hypothetical protein
MNNQQLYLAIGLPTLVVLTSLVANLIAISGIRDSINEIRADIRDVRGDITGIRETMAAMQLALSKEIGDLRTELTRDYARKQ